jgi:hypothetical protein
MRQATHPRNRPGSHRRSARPEDLKNDAFSNANSRIQFGWKMVICMTGNRFPDGYVALSAGKISGTLRRRKTAEKMHLRPDFTGAVKPIFGAYKVCSGPTPSCTSTFYRRPTPSGLIKLIAGIHTFFLLRRTFLEVGVRTFYLAIRSNYIDTPNIIEKNSIMFESASTTKVFLPFLPPDRFFPCFQSLIQNYRVGNYLNAIAINYMLCLAARYLRKAICKHFSEIYLNPNHIIVIIVILNIQMVIPVVNYRPFLCGICSKW